MVSFNIRGFELNNAKSIHRHVNLGLPKIRKEDLKKVYTAPNQAISGQKLKTFLII